MKRNELFASATFLLPLQCSIHILSFPPLSRSRFKIEIHFHCLSTIVLAFKSHLGEGKQSFSDVFRSLFWCLSESIPSYLAIQFSGLKLLRMFSHRKDLPK